MSSPFSPRTFQLEQLAALLAERKCEHFGDVSSPRKRAHLYQNLNGCNGEIAFVCTSDFDAGAGRYPHLAPQTLFKTLVAAFVVLGFKFTLASRFPEETCLLFLYECG